jgi:hypothetical protein
MQMHTALHLSFSSFSFANRVVREEQKKSRSLFFREKGEEPLRSHLKLVFFFVQERKSNFSVRVFDEE